MKRARKFWISDRRYNNQMEHTTTERRLLERVSKSPKIKTAPHDDTTAAAAAAAAAREVTTRTATTLPPPTPHYYSTHRYIYPMSGVEVGATLDNAEVSTTEGELNLYDYFDGTCWGVLFCQVGCRLPLPRLPVHTSPSLSLSRQQLHSPHILCLRTDGSLHPRGDDRARGNISTAARVRGPKGQGYWPVLRDRRGVRRLGG